MADKVGGGAWYYVGGGTEPNSPIEVVPAEKRQLPRAAISATIAATSNRCGIFWRMQNFFCSRKANLFQLWGPPEPTFTGSPDPKAGLEKGIWILPWDEVSEICFEIKRVNFRCTLKSPSNKSIRVHVVSQTCVAHSAVWRPCRDTTDCCYACCLQPTRPKSPPPPSLFISYIVTLYKDECLEIIFDWVCASLYEPMHASFLSWMRDYWEVRFGSRLRFGSNFFYQSVCPESSGRAGHYCKKYLNLSS